jgi:hypothetical protein
MDFALGVPDRNLPGGLEQTTPSWMHSPFVPTKSMECVRGFRSTQYRQANFRFDRKTTWHIESSTCSSISHKGSIPPIAANISSEATATLSEGAISARTILAVCARTHALGVDAFEPAQEHR